MKSFKGIVPEIYGGRLSFLRGVSSSRGISALGGAFLSSPLSKPLIKGFIKRNNIDMSEYPLRDYKSFDDFFTREIKPAKRPVDMGPLSLISPCDGLLTCLEITPELEFVIKGGRYSVASLLKNRDLAQKFLGGRCLIFRLCVHNYHRYCYFDNCQKGVNIPIRGRYYTVRPEALGVADYFSENSREYTLLKTENFGTAVQVEIGAAMVGKIVNLHQAGSFKRGEEKGMFRFGGSTIVLLLQKGSCGIFPEIEAACLKGEEYPVRMGQAIGTAL